MRIRVTETGKRYQVVEESATYYIVEGPLAILKSLATVVPDVVWNEIGLSCTIAPGHEGVDIYHNGVKVRQRDDYRLRFTAGGRIIVEQREP